MIYQRLSRRMCVAMVLLTLTVKMVLATGTEESVGSVVSNLAARESFISWMLYLEMGQVYSPQQAKELTRQAALAGETPPESEKPAQPLEPDKPAMEQPDGNVSDEENPEPAQPEVPPEPAEKMPEDGDDTLPADVPAEQTQPPLTFTQADGDAITIAGACTYEVDKQALLEKPLDLDLSGQSPTVLIVHTHTSEAYTQAAGWEYAESDRLRTQDAEHNVVRVGEELAQVLRGHGIAVLHDTTVNDYPSYNGAYTRTLARIEELMAQYPSIQMVLDVHRDAQEDAEGNPLGSVLTIDSQPSSQVMLVVGTDEGGLEHPHWRENLALALQLQAVTNRSYPGLLRNLNLRTERFNQHVTKGSLLLEIGSTGNTLEQALTAARAVGESLAQLLAAYA